MVEFEIVVSKHRFWYLMAWIFSGLQLHLIMPRTFKELIRRAVLVNGRNLSKGAR